MRSIVKFKTDCGNVKERPTRDQSTSEFLNKYQNKLSINYKQKMSSHLLLCTVTYLAEVKHALIFNNESSLKILPNSQNINLIIRNKNLIIIFTHYITYSRQVIGCKRKTRRSLHLQQRQTMEACFKRTITQIIREQTHPKEN